MDVKSFVDTIINAEKDKKPSKEEVENLVKSMYNGIEKFIDKIIKIKMGREVERMVKKKNLDLRSIADESNTYAGLKKAIYIIFSKYPAIKSKIEKTRKSKLYFPVMKSLI